MRPGDENKMRTSTIGVKRSRQTPPVAQRGTILASFAFPLPNEEKPMNSIIYLVGLVVIVLFILSFFGMR